MMAKIVQGNSFGNAVNYVLNRKEADIIATKGVRNIDKESIIRSFEMQARLGNIAKPVAHISLDFSAQDREKLTNAKMIEIADEYMKKMGYGNTQVLIVRHTDRDHPHIHLIMNRIDFNGKRISDQNERFRSMALCKEITLKHGLYVSSGKENVKRERLREPDATKYRIYDALVKHVPQSKSWQELRSRLRTERNGRACHPCNNRSIAPNTTKVAPLATPLALYSIRLYSPTVQTPKRRHSANECNAKRKKGIRF